MKTIKIYQLKNTDIPYYNCCYTTAKNSGFSLDDYVIVHTDTRKAGYNLNDCFEEFSCNPPKNYKGRQLSFSDLIELNGIIYYISGHSFEVVKVIGAEDWKRKTKHDN